ncbi:MAG: M56 family metallopeptidase [Crocinitomicaceae bacterium]
MSLLQFILIQLNLVAFFAIYQLINRKSSHLNFNRIYLILGPIAAILLPFAPSLYTSSTVQNYVFEMPAIEILANSSVSSVTSQFSWSVILYALIAIGFMFALGKQLNQASKLKNAKLLSNYKGVDVYLAENRDSSFSFFSSIYIGESHLDHAEIILLHEYAHCRQKHTLDIIYGNIFKALFWFNPIAHIWLKSIKENHEFLADQYVIKESVEFEKYATTLLEVSFNCSIPVVSNGFNAPSVLLKRIQKMKHKNQIHMKHLVLIPVLAGMLITTTSMTNYSAPAANEVVSTLGDHVDQKAEYVGGMDAMIAYFNKKMEYPKNLAKKNVEGKVFVEFTVKADGTVTEVHVLRADEHKEFNDAAVKLVEQMPKWKPAVKDGKKVSSKMQLPIVYKLS